MTIVSPDRPVVELIPVSLPSHVHPLKPVPSKRSGRLLTSIILVVTGVVAGVVSTRQFAPGPTIADKSTVPNSEKGTTPDDGIVTFGPDKQAAAGVEVLSVSPEPLVSRVWRTGRVALHDDRLAHVCPQAEGVVWDVPTRLGQTVAAGETLVVIDCRELGQAKLETYKAKLALAAERELALRTRTTMANADELLKLLSADAPLSDIEKRMVDKPIGDWRQQLLGAYTRRNQLRTQLALQLSSGGAVSESNLRKTEAESETAGAMYTSLVEELRFQVKNQVRQAELKLKDAEAAFDVAKAKLLLFGLSAGAVERLDPISEGSAASHLKVKAPFAGTVVEKHAVRSERVDPKTQMFILADLSAVWVQADVFESDLPLVRGAKGRTVVFRSVAAGVAERPARIVYAGDLIDKSSRALTLTAEADNADRLLKPGMFVEVGFDAGDPTPALQIPASAVLRHENKPFVFVQTSDDRFRRADLTLGRIAGERVEVTAGLATGDRVVVRGGFVLKSELLKDLLAGE